MQGHTAGGENKELEGIMWPAIIMNVLLSRKIRLSVLTCDHNGWLSEAKVQPCYVSRPQRLALKLSAVQFFGQIPVSQRFDGFVYLFVFRTIMWA